MRSVFLATGMMPAVFLTLLVLSCTYAFVRGGAPERLGAAILIAGTAASAFALLASRERYLQPEVATMWIDLIMLVALLAIALKAQRYWPMWVSTVHLDLTATHLVMFAPETQAWSYWAMQALLSYPAPILLAAGTYRHRQRLRRYGTDPPWSRHQ